MKTLKKAHGKDLKARAIELIDLVDYCRGSIVSREIINKKSGTVTLFAFDKGQGLSEHTAPFDALVYLLDGQAQVRIAGEPLSLKKGQMVIMPAHKPHSLKAIKKFKMALVMLR